MSVLPNIYDRAQLREFATAPDAVPLTARRTDADRRAGRRELRRRRTAGTLQGHDVVRRPRAAPRRRCDVGLLESIHSRRRAQSDRSLQPSDPRRRLPVLQRPDSARPANRRTRGRRRRGANAARHGEHPRRPRRGVGDVRQRRQDDDLSRRHERLRRRQRSLRQLLFGTRPPRARPSRWPPFRAAPASKSKRSQNCRKRAEASLAR